ncbi:MAG: flavin reductase, partial [Pseudomonas helleri]
LALAKAVEEDLSSTLGAADAQALKVLLKRLIVVSDPGLPDLWAPR